MNNNVYINIDVDLDLFARLQKLAGAAGGAAECPSGAVYHQFCDGQ